MWTVGIAEVETALLNNYLFPWPLLERRVASKRRHRSWTINIPCLFLCCSPDHTDSLVMHPVTTLPLLSPQQAKHRQRALGSLWNTPLSSLSREQRDHRKTLPTAGSIFQAPQDPRPKRPTAAVPSSAPGALERRSRPLAKPKREARRHEIGVACFDINHPLARGGGGERGVDNNLLYLNNIVYSS